MLERLDNKYVIRSGILQRAAPLLAQHFDALEIGGKRAFSYVTRYFDDAGYSGYFDHHRGRRQRCKVRIRRYDDAQTCFVEIKLKGKRGITVKIRRKHPIELFGTLDAKAMTFVRDTYRAFYGRDLDPALEPALDVRYERVSLVAKTGRERMTIDSRLKFSKADDSIAVSDEVFVVETKSPNGNGIADKILRGFHQHSTRNCSKYCIGIASLRTDSKRNNFLPTLRKFYSTDSLNRTLRPMVRPSCDRAEPACSELLRNEVP